MLSRTATVDNKTFEHRKADRKVYVDVKYIPKIGKRRTTIIHIAFMNISRFDLTISTMTSISRISMI